MARIRKKWRTRALDNDAFNKVKKLLNGAKTAEDIIERCKAECKRLGYEITTKSSSSMKWSKMTTTYYKEIRLGEDFDEEPDWAQAVTWAHEMVHVYQWRLMGKVTFARRYLSALWRWVIEMQAYRMSIHIFEQLGANKEWVERYIRQKPDHLRGPYAFWRIRKSDLRKYTRIILRTELG